MNIVKIQEFFICITDMNIVTSTCLLAHPLYNHYTHVLYIYFGSEHRFFSTYVQTGEGGGAVDENSL